MMKNNNIVEDEQIEILDLDDNKSQEVSGKKSNNNENKTIKDDVLKKKNRKEKKKRKKENNNKRKMYLGEKIFFFINLFIIFGIIGFYAYRTIYYYKISHVINEEITLHDQILSFGSVVYQNDGLYEKDGVYYFKGMDVNNYLFYSGRMFRIIEVNKGIKAIEEDTTTNLVWGVDTDYKESIIYSWLEDKYVNSLKDYEVYLKKNNWCNEAIDIENYECKEEIKDYVGLLNVEEYLRAGGKNSFLNNNTFFWTVNQDLDHKALYINNEGTINNLNAKDENYFSYGVRGVVTFRDDLLLVTGDGTKENPYIIEDEAGVLVKDKPVGSYVNYSDEIFRIIDIDDDGVSLILDGVLEESRTYNDALNYLNNEYIKKFNLDNLVKINYGIGEYRYESKYSFLFNPTNSYYAIIPKVGDLFLNDYANYWLSNSQNYGLGLFYVLDENKMFFADLNYNVHLIRPIIKVKKDLIVKKGNGSKDNPYVIGEDNVEED